MISSTRPHPPWLLVVIVFLARARILISSFIEGHSLPYPFLCSYSKHVFPFRISNYVCACVCTCVILLSSLHYSAATVQPPVTHSCGFTCCHFGFLRDVENQSSVWSFVCVPAHFVLFIFFGGGGKKGEESTVLTYGPSHSLPTDGLPGSDLVHSQVVQPLEANNGFDEPIPESNKRRNLVHQVHEDIFKELQLKRNYRDVKFSLY